MMEGRKGSLLVHELAQGVELAKQLRNNLGPSSFSPSSSIQEGQLLIQKILSSYEKAISMLSSAGEFSAEETTPRLRSQIDGCSDHSNGGPSPRSEGSGLDCKNEFGKTVCKKRKISDRKTERVKACSETEDGYCWRKYGQKDILGSKFPRAYYRCTHRFTQGCLATKQIQKSDDDPSVVEITYIGMHKCSKPSTASPQPDDKHQPDQPRKPRETTTFDLQAVESSEPRWTKDEIFRTFSFSDIELFENVTAKDALFGRNDLAPTATTTTTTTDYDDLFSHSPRRIFIRHDSSSLNFESTSAANSITNSPIEDLDISDFDFDFKVEGCNVKLFT